MHVESLRSDHDISLYKKLLENQDIKRLNAQIEEREAQGPLGTRRHLLTTSVRLSNSMAPEIHKTADECIERLGIEIPVELYVYASPSYNAACVKPESGRLFIMFSSSLLEAFTGSEFRFVMGHELGHYMYGHHDIPIGYAMNSQNRPDPKLALQLSAWSRYAEVSADRAGAHCAQDFQGLARALFKLASGLSGSVVQFDLNEFLAQLDDLQIADEDPAQQTPSSDWFMTHPFSPLRVKALQLFHSSDLAIENGISKSELEHGVKNIMGLMEPSYLEGKNEASESMRRLLFAASLIIADAHQNISAEEIAVFEKFFGPHSFNDKLNLSTLKSELPSRIESVKQQTSIGQRMQILSDLRRIACAEGTVHYKELSILKNLADGLGVSRDFLDTINCALKALD